MRRVSLMALLAAISLGGGTSARAGLTFDLATTVNGSTPEGTLQASFVDTSANTVQLTLTSNLTPGSGESIARWGFNVDSSFTDFKDVSFSTTETGGPDDPTLRAFSSNNSAFNPKSVGKFDLVLGWTGSDHSFGPGGVVTVTMTYTGTQTFNSSIFDAKSSGGTIPGAPFFTAAKIRGIHPGGSGELGNDTGQTITTQAVAAPEPTTLVSGAIGIIVSLGGLWLRCKPVRA